MAIQAMLERYPGGKEGTATYLKKELESFKQDGEGWPKSAKGMADAFRRIAPALRTLDIEITRDDHRRRDGYHFSIKYSD